MKLVKGHAYRVTGRDVAGVSQTRIGFYVGRRKCGGIPGRWLVTFEVIGDKPFQIVHLDAVKIVEVR